MSTKRIFGLVGAGVLLLIVLFSLGNLIEVVDAADIVVKQSVGGTLDVWTEPGPQWQNFGKLTTYPKSAQLDFGGQINVDESASSAGTDHNGAALSEDQLKKLAKCLPIRFNDNGTAKLCGSISFDLPTDADSMRKLHIKFRSFEAIVQRVVLPALMKAAYNSGPMMSSRESAGDRRAELLEILREQATIGIYQVEVTEATTEDLMAEPVEAVETLETPVLDKDGNPMLNPDGTPKMEKKAKIVKKHPLVSIKVVRPRIENGKPVLAEQSAAAEFGLRFYNFTINRLIYDPRVKKQIEAQQEATMAIQTARVNSQKAEQDALTAKAQGEANIARAKAEKDVEKQAAVTAAEQKREVARLDLESADFERQAAIKRAEGEAEARKLVMVADGALEKKLAAYIQVNKVWAEAAAKQPLVPSVVMGASAGGVGVDQFMTLKTADLAKDLALDMRVKQ